MVHILSKGTNILKKSFLFNLLVSVSGNEQMCHAIR